MGPDFDSFDDIQCEDVYDENYVIENDFDDEVVSYDDLMDGDFDSAMASAGWGTDEDYGCYEY